MLRRCRPWLGTFVEVAAAGADEALLDRAFARVAHVHARMSFHEPNSDLASLRQAPAGSAVNVDADTVAVLRLAKDLHVRTEGLFDVAVGAALVSSGFLPRPKGADLRRMTGNTADIEIVDECTVICHRPMLIDLGGIAKGYAVDQAMAVLAAGNVAHAIVNAGGDLRVLGSTNVFLRDADGEVRNSVVITDASLASSSNLHSRRRHRGRDHVPHLGWNRTPLLTDEAVSVIARDCAIADALTKVALAAPARAAQLAAEQDGWIVNRTALLQGSIHA